MANLDVRKFQCFSDAVFAVTSRLENKRRKFQEIEGNKAAKIGSNTTIRFDKDSNVIVRLYATDIATFTPEYIVVNTGGFNTVTTRDRLNQVLPFGAYTEKNILKINGQPINITGKFTYEGAPVETDADTLTAKKALWKEIDKLIDAYLENPVEPQTGDCFYCSMFGATSDCILSHIAAKYAHGSLYVNAMRAAGYQDAGIRYYFEDLKKYRRKDIVKRAMRKYLRNMVDRGEVKETPRGTMAGIHNNGSRY